MFVTKRKFDACNEKIVTLEKQLEQLVQINVELTKKIEDLAKSHEVAVTTLTATLRIHQAALLQMENIIYGPLPTGDVEAEHVAAAIDVITAASGKKTKIFN